MPKFRVYGTITAHKYLGEFEAETKEEAERMAWDSDELELSVCHHCSRDIQEPVVTRMIVKKED